MPNPKRIVCSLSHHVAVGATSIFLLSIVAGVGITAIWILSAAFVPDRSEAKIKSMIGYPLIVAAASLGIAVPAALLRDRLGPGFELEQTSRRSQCHGCRYRSHSLFLQPCAVHRGKLDNEPCSDYSPEIRC